MKNDVWRIVIVVKGDREKAEMLLEDVLALSAPTESIMGLSILASAVLEAGAGLNDILNRQQIALKEAADNALALQEPIEFTTEGVEDGSEE